MKQYVALARVSSREQEREGFSLEVQEDALKKYAETHGGKIVKLFKVAETASKRDERKTFKEMMSYAKKHAFEFDGLLFYNVDRAARNLFDYVELERLESEYQVPFISISQQTDNNPAGRMMRRTLANMASFFTEQMAVDISQGINRLVQEGMFPGKAPYGYKNTRANGRRVIQLDQTEAAKVRDWFRAVLASKTKDAQADTRAQRAELQRQETLIAGHQDRLLNLRIDGQIDDDTFNR